MYYNIRDEDSNEIVGSELSYGELCQYLMDCYSQENYSDEELEKIEADLYNENHFPLFNSINYGKNIEFSNYSLKIEEI